MGKQDEICKLTNLLSYLEGGDLRSIGKVEELIGEIETQKDFDMLFDYIHSKDRLIAMRAADALEKLSKTNESFLHPHKAAILSLLETATNKEFKWHLAILTSRVKLDMPELQKVWQKLTDWVSDQSESRIVRVNALESMWSIASRNERFKPALHNITQQLKKEQVPSIISRLKKLGIQL